jgi:hypothetical protein
MKEKGTTEIQFDTVDNLQLLIDHLKYTKYKDNDNDKKLHAEVNKRAIDNNTNAEEHGGNFFFNDAFDPEFINSHLSMYDVIMVPDCNNKYMNLQSKQLPDGNYEILPFILICLELTKMLKPSGTIQFSKFLKFNKCIAPNNIGVLDDNKYKDLHTALKDNTYLEFVTKLKQELLKESCYKLVEHENGHLALELALKYNQFEVETPDCIYGKMLVATKQNSTKQDSPKQDSPKQDSPKQPSQRKPNSSVACAVMGGKSIKTKKKKRKSKLREPTVPL